MADEHELRGDGTKYCQHEDILCPSCNSKMVCRWCVLGSCGYIAILFCNLCAEAYSYAPYLADYKQPVIQKYTDKI